MNAALPTGSRLTTDDGANLSLLVLGQGAPVVLVHGTGMGARALWPLAQALARTHRVLLYDRRGWGTSTLGKSRDLSLARHARDLQCVLSTLDAPATVFGWSSGGLISLEAAAQRGTTPRALVLYEAPFGASRDSTPGARADFLAMLAWNGLRQPRRARRAFWNMVSRRAQGPTGFEHLPPTRQSELLDEPGPLVAEALAGTGTSEALRALGAEVRVRLLVGTASTASAHRCSERLQALLPHATRERVPSADHLYPLTHPEECAQWLRDPAERSATQAH
ncbi:alpha/beta hydrolase [Corallococcus sp. M34]|uniref:alpha/beta fold hydrolase n=1 Tax=Citreicoccus inhibens TaxID=2849499 RepID=UPI00131518B5|nr:alpha/beta hydrolase [Citreicoccus inhibens]MBU8898050.1 alpha/beta hydrolase [Citreicoccus inhibens]